jgi:hypothetical protein
VAHAGTLKLKPIKLSGFLKGLFGKRLECTLGVVTKKSEPGCDPSPICTKVSIAPQDAKVELLGCSAASRLEDIVVVRSVS